MSAIRTSDTKNENSKNPLMTKAKLLTLLKEYQKEKSIFDRDTVQIKLLKKFIKSSFFKELNDTDEVTFLDFTTYLEKNKHNPSSLFTETSFKEKTAASNLLYRFMYWSFPPFKTYQTSTSYMEYKKGPIVQQGAGKGATGLLNWDNGTILKINNHAYSGTFDILNSQSLQLINSRSGRGYDYTLTCLAQLSDNNLLASQYDGMHSCGVIRVIHKTELYNWVNASGIIKIGRAEGVTAATTLSDGRIVLGLYDSDYRWGQLSLLDRNNNITINLSKGSGKGATALATLPDGRVLRGIHDCKTNWGEITILDIESMQETVLATGYNEGATTFLVLSDNRILRAISNYTGNGYGELSIFNLNLNLECQDWLENFFGKDVGNIVANFLYPTEYKSKKTVNVSQSKCAMFKTPEKSIDTALENNNVLMEIKSNIAP